MNRILVALAVAGTALTGASVQAQGPEFNSTLEFSPFMVAISVEDMDAVSAWYVEALDFHVEKDASLRDGAVHFRWLSNGTQRIELVKSVGSQAGTRHPAPPGHAAVQGFTHLTLETDDIDHVSDILAARGIAPALDVTPVDALGIRVMYLVDPEGNAVEIAQKNAS